MERHADLFFALYHNETLCDRGVFSIFVNDAQSRTTTFQNTIIWSHCCTDFRATHGGFQRRWFGDRGRAPSGLGQGSA